ncbi:MAG TPA: PadR family transcriptional regulator [Gryllotalpicola sp.]
MVLEILILSSLRKGPMHGYELKQQVQRPTFTRLGNSSLYPALRRFEHSGAVTQHIEEQDGKPSRKVYTITAAGRAELRELIGSLPPELAANEEEFLVRVGFFGELTAAERSRVLAARAGVVDAKIAQIIALIADREPSSAPDDWPARATDRFLRQLREERGWIEQLSVENEEQDDDG